MAIEYQGHPGSNAISFRIDSDNNLLDNLAFTHLIMMKFTGDEDSIEFFKNGKDVTFHVKIKFSNWERCSEAKGHCDRNITQEGVITADYKGALEHADPRQKMAHAMKTRATEISF